MQPDADVYRRLADSSRDGLWLLDGEGRTLYANDRMAELLGYTPEELRHVSAIDVHDEDGRVQFEQHLAEMRAGHPGADNLEALYAKADGTPIWLLVSWHPVPGADGEVIGWLHRYTEYTRRRQLLDSLRDRENLLATAQSIAQIGAWEWIVETNEVLWSEQLYKIYKVTPDELDATYEGFLDFVHPEDREIVTSAVGSIFGGAEEFAWDARVIASDGEVRWVRGLGRAERDEAGQVTRMSGTAQDITDRVLADMEVMEATRRLALLRAVAEAANESTSLVETLLRAASAVHGTPGWEPMCVFVREGDGRLAALEITDTDVELPEPDVELAEEAWRSRAMAFVAAPGRELTHSVVAMPVVAGDSVACVIELLADENPPDDNSRDLMTQIGAQLSRVAERERAAAVLAEARDQAMEASRLKSEFLATMSHEIRTPMNGVIGLADLLLQTDLDASQRRHAEALHGAGLTLLGIINDILDVSKIEAGKLELEVTDFDIATVLQRTRDLLAGPAADKGLALSVRHDPEMPRWLTGDAGRLGQILANLGSNAVKFTDQGEVRISASATSQAEGSVLLRLEVSDTGQGIEPLDQERLFEPFVQLDPSTTRRHGGTGLGLTIVLQLAHALGGSITVDSEVGRGSTFVLTAPFARADGDPAEREGPGVRRVRPANAPVHRVLVVEDNPVNQMVATGLLENAGYATDVAEDGRGAGAHGAGGPPQPARQMEHPKPPTWTGSPPPGRSAPRSRGASGSRSSR